MASLSVSSPDVDGLLSDFFSFNRISIRSPDYKGFVSGARVNAAWPLLTVMKLGLIGWFLLHSQKSYSVLLLNKFRKSVPGDAVFSLFESLVLIK